MRPRSKINTKEQLNLINKSDLFFGLKQLNTTFSLNKQKKKQLIQYYQSRKNYNLNPNYLHQQSISIDYQIAKEYKKTEKLFRKHKTQRLKNIPIQVYKILLTQIKLYQKYLKSNLILAHKFYLSIYPKNTLFIYFYIYTYSS